MATKCKKMNNKKRKDWNFYEIRVENKRRSFHHRLKKYFKEQLCNFLERNEYSLYINQRYVLTYVFLLIIQGEYDTFCCRVALIVLSTIYAVSISDKVKFTEATTRDALYKKLLLNVLQFSQEVFYTKSCS